MITPQEKVVNVEVAVAVVVAVVTEVVAVVTEVAVVVAVIEVASVEAEEELKEQKVLKEATTKEVNNSESMMKHSHHYLERPKIKST